MNRELIIRGLSKKRLVSLAKSLCAFSTDRVTREELMDKIQRSSSFGTLVLLDFLTLAELKTVARRLGVEPKAREKIILRDRIFASPMLRTKKKGLESAKSKPKPKPKSKPIKRFIIKRVKGRNSQDDFVHCPICERERTFYQLFRHVSRTHPETLKYQIYARREGSHSSVILTPEKHVRSKIKTQL